MVASLPRPPEVENTNGINEADSTLRTRSPYSQVYVYGLPKFGDRLVH